MADQHDRRQQVENLVSQDPHINDTNMRDFRMQLENTLIDFERRGARLRWIAVRAIVAFLVTGVALLLVPPVPPGFSSYNAAIAFFFFIANWAALIVGGYATIRYFVEYSPAIRRLRYDIQNSMIAELQQQVVALRAELRTRPPGGDTRSS